jgi:hypothetical protein
VAWRVNYTGQFGDWFRGLEQDQQDAVVDRVELLETHGPTLGRPLVDKLFDEYLHERGGGSDGSPKLQGAQ